MKRFQNFFFEILSLPYFQKFNHSKISTYTVLHLHDTTLEVYKCSIYDNTDTKAEGFLQAIS